MLVVVGAWAAAVISSKEVSLQRPLLVLLLVATVVMLFVVVMIAINAVFSYASIVCTVFQKISCCCRALLRCLQREEILRWRSA